MVASQKYGPDGLTVFVPNGENRRETAVLLVGTAREHNLSPRSIHATNGGFYISDELADLLGEDTEVEDTEEESEDDVLDTAALTVDEVKEYVEENPDEAEAILADEEDGKNRSSLVKWLSEFIETSGDRAAKN